MPASRNTSQNTKEGTDVDCSSVQSTVSTRTPTPPGLVDNQFQGKLSTAHWNLNEQHAALGALRADLETKFESLERKFSYHLDGHKLTCNSAIVQLDHDVAQHLGSFNERLGALEKKQIYSSGNSSESMLQRIDMLSGRLELTNHKIKQMSYAMPAERGIALDNRWAQCSPGLDGLSRKIDLMESTVEVITSRLDHVDARLIDAFTCVEDASSKVLNESVLKEQLLELGSKFEIVDSKLSVLLSCSEISGDSGTDNRNFDWRERLIDPSTDQITNDFAAKLCGVSERLGRIEEQMSQDFRVCEDKLKTGTQCYLLQLMINHFVEALAEDSQSLACLQQHFAAQLAEREKCTSIGIIEI